MGDDLFGLGRLKDRIIDGAQRGVQQKIDKTTQEAQDAAKRKAMKETGITDETLRDAQDPAGAAERKLREKTRQLEQKGQQKINEGVRGVEQGVQGQVDKTTKQTEQGIIKGFNGGGSKPDAAAEAERLQREAEEQAEITRKTPKTMSEAERKALETQAEVERQAEITRKTPKVKSQAEIDAEEEQKKYMRPQSFEGTPTTPSGAQPISYDVGSQKKGDLTEGYEKALGLKGADEEVAPLVKPGQAPKI